MSYSICDFMFAVTMDPLESRCYMTAGVRWTDGVLVVTGTDQEDEIRIVLAPNGVDDKVEVLLNGVNQSWYALSTLSAINVDGGAGHDEIIVDFDIKLPLTVDGRDGLDVVRQIPDAPPIELSSGVLHVNGSNDVDDQILVSVTPDGESLRVVINGQSMGTYAQRDVNLLRISGLLGDDVIRVDDAVGPISAEVQINGDGGDDHVTGPSSATDCFLAGGAGDDVILSGTSGDMLVGNSGNDTLRGGRGNDILCGDDDGGPPIGADRLEIGADDYPIESDPNDTVVMTSDDDRNFPPPHPRYRYYDGGWLEVGGTDDDDILVLRAGDNGGVEVTVNGELLGEFPYEDVRLVEVRTQRGDDLILVDESNGIIRAQLDLDASIGNDTIVGSSRNDRLEGGAGDDLMFGRGGDDYFWGDEGYDSIIPNDGDGEVAELTARALNSSQYALTGSPVVAQYLAWVAPSLFDRDGDDNTSEVETIELVML